MRNTVQDLLIKELQGKKVYTKDNIPFIVECVIGHYEPMVNKYKDNFTKHILEPLGLNMHGIKLVGYDKLGKVQELVVADLNLLQLFYCDEPL